MFKGGTSLLLHVSKIKRLSIDIDIIYGGDIEIFNGKLVEISNNLPFTRFEEDKRGHRGLPNRRHFKFFYNSTISKNEEYVLLDIVLENSAYIPFTEIKLIKTDLFDLETDLSVKIPTIEGLPGDNLAADFLEDGIRKINSHLLDDKFTTDTEAKITAAKVFCIANFLLNEKTLDFNKSMYKDKMIDSLAAINLPAPFQRLNRLKQIIPEAFYYIWLGIEG